MASHHTEVPVLEPGVDIKPQLSKGDVQILLKTLYGFEGGAVKELIAFDDLNYYTEPEINRNPNTPHLWPHGYVLKVMNSLDSKNLPLTEGQNELMLFLQANGITATVPVKNLSGTFYSVEKLPISGEGDGSTQQKHVVRLLEFQPGRTLRSFAVTYAFMYHTGKFVGNLDEVLRNFSHPVYKSHKSLWLLDSSPKLKAFTFVIQDVYLRNMVESIINEFTDEVLPKLNSLQKGMIHNDINENNLIVDSSMSGELKIAAVLDFGDSNESYYLFELAITMCYMMFQCHRSGLDPLNGAGHVLAGYKSVFPITDLEYSLLKICICTRFCQSFVMGLYTHTLHPENEYIMQSQDGWPILIELWNTPNDETMDLWQSIEDSYHD